QFMLGLLEHSPDLYLDEIQEQLYSLYWVDISIATIWQTMKHLGISSKKVSRLSKGSYTMVIGNEPPDQIVCVNESAMNILTTFWMNGWSYGGLCAHKRCNFV
ncbi:hypothetical protein PAXRUDRAFT_70621, partial [Paxillus rubicundulus Ve08.2h10]